MLTSNMVASVAMSSITCLIEPPRKSWRLNSLRKR
ncbi:head protein [Escherichia coli O121:H19 str. 2011C-3609]|nr:head protein [Escherichia coli O121:H19 str. 2011C-3609]